MFLTCALCAASARAYTGGRGVDGPGWHPGVAGANARAAGVGRAKDTVKGCGGDKGGEMDRETGCIVRIPSSGFSARQINEDSMKSKDNKLT
jgi:hypothetical protein